MVLDNNVFKIFKTGWHSNEQVQGSPALRR
jgi:hypothetical protein